jgi:broad specificity phosphatase PhoE
MHLVFIRHAHRDTSFRAKDNGLSDKGQRQARALSRIFEERVSSEASKVKLFSSPKRRCVETLQPIADIDDLKIEISPLLDEQQEGENDTQFRARVAEFMSSVQTQFKGPKGNNDWVLVCTHGDWLPLVLGDVQISKGCWAQMEGGRLVALLQPDELRLI